MPPKVLYNPQPFTYPEALTFWKDKVPLSPGDFRKLADGAKAKAFAVTGIAKGDELTTVYTALQKALEKGTTFREFKKDAAAVFAKRGWDKNAPWRIETIFRTNIQSAYSAGRYKQMKETTELRPFWQFDSVIDNRSSEICPPLNGAVYAADDPFWDSWYPPNHFRCRSGVISLSRRQVEKRGLDIQTGDPDGKLFEPLDPKTGQKLSARQVKPPSPGFRNNPGKSQYGGITPAEGVTGFEDIGKKTYADYKRKKLGHLPKRAYLPFSNDDLLDDLRTLKNKTNLSGKAAERHYLDAFLKEFGLDTGESTVFKDVVGDPLIISEDLFRLQDGSFKVTKRNRERFLKLLARTIQDPYEVWLVPQRNKRTGAIVFRKRFIRAFSSGPDKKITGFCAFDYGKSGWEGVTAFAPDKLSYADKLRNGLLLYPKKK